MAIVLLVAILGLVFFRLWENSRAVLVEAERERRHAALLDAVHDLNTRLDESYFLARELAGVEALIDLLSEDPREGDDPLAPYRQLDGALRELGEKRGALLLAVLPAEGEAPLFHYARGATTPPPLAGLALPPAAAEARRSGGNAAFDLVVDGERARLDVAILVERDASAVVCASLDVSPELRAFAAAAQGGSWALVAEAADEPAAPRLLAPAGAPALTAFGPALRENATVVHDGAVLSAMRLPRARWRLLARAPTREAARVMAELGSTLVLAAVAVVLVLTIGMGGAEARARASYLQRTLEESERQERFLQAIFDAITDPLVVVDADLRVIRANRVAAERYGRDLVGRAYVEAFAERAGDPAPEAVGLREVLGSGLPRKSEVRSPRGERVWQLAQFPIFSADGRVRGAVEYAVDVTQTRLLEAQLVQREKLSTLGEMAAGIAHEINNPLGVVSMFAELLEEELQASGEGPAVSEGALEKVRTIQEQASNVGEIVKSLLRFARKSEGTKSPLDVRDALDRAMAIVEHQKMCRRLEVVRDVDLDPPPVVLGDEGQLAQVVLNLVVNAHHAMDGEGRLGLEVRRRGPDDPPPRGRPFGEPPAAGERVLVVVSDTGEGIAPDDLERLFEPFFTTKPVGEGTGLGLSVGFGIIRDHGGCIWVASEVGVGTTFTIELPAAPPVEPPAEREEAA